MPLGFGFSPLIESVAYIAWWVLQGAGIVVGCWAIAKSRESKKSQRQSDSRTTVTHGEGQVRAERAAAKLRMSPWKWSGWWRRFRTHTAAVASLAVLASLYPLAIFCEFAAPYGLGRSNIRQAFAPPQGLHFFDESGVFYPRPFVYGVKFHWDPTILAPRYESDLAAKHSLHLIVKGDPYRMWGLFEMNLHLFGLEDKEARWLILGADSLGGDMFSNMLYGARIPLLIGLLGAIVSLMIGSYIDGTIGYYSFVVGIPYLLFGEMYLATMGFRAPLFTNSWGVMVSNALGRWSFVRVAPWTLLPGLAVALTSALFVLVGQGLREVDSLPRGKHSPVPRIS